MPQRRKSISSCCVGLKINQTLLSFGQSLEITQMKLRVVDFRWYYSALAELGVSYYVHAKFFSCAAWLSKTFNLILITAFSGKSKHPII